MYSDHGLKIHISYSVAIFLYDQCIAEIRSITIEKFKEKKTQLLHTVYTKATCSIYLLYTRQCMYWYVTSLLQLISMKNVVFLQLPIACMHGSYMLLLFLGQCNRSSCSLKIMSGLVCCFFFVFVVFFLTLVQIGASGKTQCFQGYISIISTCTMDSLGYIAIHQCDACVSN